MKADIVCILFVSHLLFIYFAVYLFCCSVNMLLFHFDIQFAICILFVSHLLFILLFIYFAVAVQLICCSFILIFSSLLIIWCALSFNLYRFDISFYAVHFAVHLVHESHFCCSLSHWSAFSFSSMYKASIDIMDINFIFFSFAVH